MVNCRGDLMYKFIRKNIFRLMFAFILFFSYVELVGAKWFQETITSNNVFVNCNSDNECVPLCIYGENKAMIGYYYNDIPNKWELSFHQITRQLQAPVNMIYYTKDTRVPNTDIYFEDEKGVEWSEAKRTTGMNAYERLTNEFECPSRIYIDESSLKPYYNELCFENQFGLCGEQSKLGTSFNSPIELNYDFISEYKDVTINAYESLYERYSIDDLKKVELLSIIDGGSFSFDSSLSFESNAKNNCSSLKQNVDGKLENYLDMLNGKEYVNKFSSLILDVELQNQAKQFNAKNPMVYYYTKLNSMFSGKNVVLYDGEPIFKQFSNLYASSIITSVRAVSNYCNDFTDISVDMRIDTDGDGILDSDNMNDIAETAKKVLELKIYEDVVLDEETLYNCSLLSDIADIISTGYFIIEIVAVVILIAFSTLDYAKVILSGEAEQMKKTNNKFFTRIILVAVIFLLPMVLNLVLKVFKIEGINSENPLCVEIKN